MMARAGLAGVILAAGALAGCMVGPRYRQPAIATPADYAEAGALPAGVTRDAGAELDADLASWWTGLRDPVLNALVRRAIAGNPDLAAAASRVRAARQAERVTAAAEWPTVSASGDAITYNSNRAAAASLPVPSHLNLYAAGFDASWEVDLFGGTRRAIQAAKANTAAADWARRDGQVTLVAEVANDYLALRVFQARIALGRDELRREQDLQGLVNARRASGFVTDLDVNQQAVAVANAAAQIPQLVAEADVRIHALGVLLGQPPEILASELQSADARPPSAPSALPVGLPSELLRRRPDIREAERRLASASATIGVNEAALYPRLNLLGLASFGGMTLDDLFSRRNLVSAGVGMLTQPVFNAGKTRASIAQAKEQEDQARLAYEATVFAAFRDVEDALARYKAEDTRRTRLAQAVTAAESTLRIATDQYRTGFVTYINVLQAQDALLNDRDQLVQSDGLILTDLVALYKALGGGWAG
jgi:NodT family efflux transporter outer membrane factor (OMF) lipoprotein